MDASGRDFGVFKSKMSSVDALNYHSSLSKSDRNCQGINGELDTSRGSGELPMMSEHHKQELSKSGNIRVCQPSLAKPTLSRPDNLFEETSSVILC